MFLKGTFLNQEKLRILKGGFAAKCVRPFQRLGWKRTRLLPDSSYVLRTRLSQSGYPHWTAWYVPLCDVEDDLWGQSHFNFEVDGRNYHVLRTGAFPFIKFHCSLRPWSDSLALEDSFYRVLKVINLGIPTLCYGLAGLLWAKHTEKVRVKSEVEGEVVEVTVYFWYQESPGAKH